MTDKRTLAGLDAQTFLRRTLWLDATTGAVFSLLFLAGGDALQSLFGLPRFLHLAVLAILVPSAGLMAFCALRQPLFTPGVRLVILGNAAWVVASVWLALSGILNLTAPGVAFVLAQGGAVAGLTVMESIALGRTGAIGCA